MREIIDKDSEMAELYRETYQEIKADKEYEEHEANRLYNKYKYLDSAEYTENRMYQPQYDLAEIENEKDDSLTTEMSDTELDYLYKRHKLL